MEHTLEYVMIGIYLLFLIGIGMRFRKMATNLSDYVRGGAHGTWWMVGSSMLMANISAFTFTGNAGAAFDAGLSPLIIYMAASFSFMILWLFFAARFRQTRAYTFQDIARDRFGPEVEQFNGWQAVVMGPLNAAIQLWALSVFMSSVFGFPIEGTIIVIGVVVVVYSTLGGRWAVMATDFFQSLIMISIALVMAFVCLYKVGGVPAFIEHFSDLSVKDDFAFFNEEGRWAGNRFTPTWMLAIFLSGVFTNISFVMAPHFLSVKDGKEAEKAARLVFILSVVGMFVWFIPPWTARFLYSDLVLASGVDNPSTAAYAVVAKQLLPEGLLGLLIVAMFAATMSSMDSGLNGITGTIVRNIIPALFRVLKKEPLKQSRELLVCMLVTVGLGVIIISYSLMLATQKDIEMFDIYFVIASIIGLPLTLPFVTSMFVKKLPRWSFFGIAGFALIPSLLAYFDSSFYGVEWTVQKRLLWIVVASLIGTAVCRMFYRFSSLLYKEQVREFFERMETPIPEEPVDERNSDKTQMRIMGKITILGGATLLPLYFVSEDHNSWWGILFVQAFIWTIGGLLLWYSRKAKISA